VIVEDLSTEKRFSGPPLLREHGVTSGVSCVISGGDQAYGVLGAHTRKHRSFSSEDANFLQAVATVIGSAISRSQSRLRVALEVAVANAFA
jgi:GAF domain-containing protein